MTVISSLSSGIHGALLLARGRPEGIQLVEGDRIAAIRSFWAIPLCLPAVVCLKLVDWLVNGVPSNAPVELGRYLLMFLVGWLLFVWISHHLVSVLNKGALWPRFIAVWAYCSVIENTMVAIGALPAALGAPSVVSQAANLIAIGWAFWLEWFAIRVSLQVSRVTAVLLVAIDFGIGAFTMALGSLGG